MDINRMVDELRAQHAEKERRYLEAASKALRHRQDHIYEVWSLLQRFLEWARSNSVSVDHAKFGGSWLIATNTERCSREFSDPKDKVMYTEVSIYLDTLGNLYRHGAMLLVYDPTVTYLTDVFGQHSIPAIQTWCRGWDAITLESIAEHIAKIAFANDISWYE